MELKLDFGIINDFKRLFYIIDSRRKLSKTIDGIIDECIMKYYKVDRVTDELIDKIADDEKFEKYLEKNDSFHFYSLFDKKLNEKENEFIRKIAKQLGLTEIQLVNNLQKFRDIFNKKEVK